MRLLLVYILLCLLGPARAQEPAPPAEASAAPAEVAEAPAEVAEAPAEVAEAPAEASAAPAPPAGPAEEAGYAVGPQDVLQVQVYGEPGVSGPLPVDDRGVIDFPLLGRVSVGGLTTREIATLLHDRLADGFLVEPRVSVRIDAYGSQPIQVLGAVQKPGTYYVRGQATVLDMLSQAGGVRSDGVNEVRITRGSQQGAVQVVPYLALVSQGQGNLLLAGGDVVFVPESLVYVMGEVGKPGAVAFREGLTVSRCIAAAGGALSAANLGRVYILRDDQRIRVNVRRILRGKEEDIAVQAGDQVFVQTSVL